MTSNRLRKHPAYQKGRDLADGLTLDDFQWASSHDGEAAFRAGHADRVQEIADEAERHRQATASLTELLWEAQQERDWDKLCNVIERMIK